MTTIVEHDRSLVDMFQSVLGNTAEVIASLDQLRRHLEERPQEYAVVLGSSVDATAAAAFADKMRVARPSLSIILVRKRVDTAILAEALRAGMREVVEERDLARLGEAVYRAYELWQAMVGTTESTQPSAQGRLLTVFSTKGGVGKSTLATNLAASLVDDGHKVCLVDLDVSCGDVAIMLQLFPSSTLADLASMQHALDPAAIESLLTTHSENLSVLAAPVQPDARQQVPAETVGRVLEMLKRRFDVVVVDTSGSFDDFALQAFDHSDLLLLIGTLDIPALKSLKLAVETLDLLNIPRSQWRLILNRADSKVGLSHDEVENTLGMSITTAIPSSRDVPACVNRGEPIVRAEPRHPVSASIRTLGQQTIGELNGGQLVGAGAEAEPRRGLLWRKAR